MIGPEYKLQLMIVEYLGAKHPGVKFRSDLAGLFFPKGLAQKAKRLNGGHRAWPDLLIAEPRGGFHGLFVELKADRGKLCRLNGQLRKNIHIEEQAKVLSCLRESGYMADFFCGYDETVSGIDNYLKMEKN